MYDLLKGLRVVEGSSFVAGPSCGLYLAQLGAEVIRIDNLGGGPDFRRWPVHPAGESLYWEGLNKGKKSVAIDLSRPEGRELAQLLATAPGENGGVFVTNFPVEGFLSYDRLVALRPDLICIRIMGWADGGPAVDYTINAAVGVPMMTGPIGDDRLVNHVLPAWDLLTGAFAAFALVSAVLDRRAGGGGREIRVPLSDIAASSLANLGMTAETELGGRQRSRTGNELYGAFGRDFRTRDGRQLMLVAITPRQWKGVAETLGISGKIKSLGNEVSANFDTDEGARYQHRARLFPLFESAIAQRDVADLASAFEAHGVCWSIYQPLEEALEDPRLFARNPVFEDIQHPSGGVYAAPGFAGTVPQDVRLPVRPAPRLGDDTDEILTRVLGISDIEIARLHDAAVI